MDQGGEHSRSRFAEFIHSKSTARIIDLILVPVLLIGSLWLPPASLGERLFHADYPLVTSEEGGTVPGPDGASLVVPAGAVAKNARIKMEALAAGDLAQLSADSPEILAAQNVPEYALVRGPFYSFDMYGAVPAQGSLQVPVPSDVAVTETLDLFQWDGQAWQWLPSSLSSSGAMLVSQVQQVPSLLMVAQRQPAPCRMGVASTSIARVEASGVGVNQVTITGATLDSEGGVSVMDLTGLGDTENALYLRLSNVIDGVVRSDWVDNLIIDQTKRAAHVAAIVDLASSADAEGIELAYDGVDPELKAEFTVFVTELTEALHASGQRLAVRLRTPLDESGTLILGAYDWEKLGQVADLIRVVAPASPEAYAQDGAVDRLITWVTDRIDRERVDLAIRAYAHDIEGGVDSLLPYSAALAMFASEIKMDDADGMLLPGESATLDALAEAELGLQFDPEAQVYWFSTIDDGGDEHRVLLENGSSVARKLSLVNRFALGGFSVEGAVAPGSDDDIAAVVTSFQENLVPPQPNFALVWTVENQAGDQVAQEVMSLEDSGLVWTAPNSPGDYVIKAAISDDGGNSVVNALSELNLEVPTPTFTPTNTPTPTPTDTPTPTPVPTNTPAPTAKPQPKVAAAPSVGGYFGYGVQAAMVSSGDLGPIFSHINGMGFNWVKQQIEWFRYNPAPGVYDWGGIDRIVDAANANGVNILLSVVKAPSWARPAGDTDQGPPADPNTYGTFMRELAARYKGRVKAYEIWNEQNLYYEWGGRGFKLNASKYVELLKAAYNGVKSVDPGAVVISGALTPTGYNDGDIAIDDRLYLEQMYQAGLSRYCDAVGVHPSGYNNPPDADWRTWSDPTAPSFKGHPSFFFRGTMESYRNIMVKYGDGGKRLWPTEFGWATVDGLGVAPVEGYGYAANNTEAEQAEFLVRAFQMGKAWGWVGPMFVWNLNFAPVSGKADEKAAFGIVRDDWGARPAYAGLANMPK